MILDHHVSRLLRKQKTTPRHRFAPKGKGILMGVPGMTQEWKGETVQMPELLVSSPEKARTLVS
jgi:hypothetical protein